MKVTIEIPDAFARDWERDRFEDALQRLSADAHLMAGLYEKETAAMLIRSFKSAERVKEKEGFLFK